jgi:hypothetical protein
MILVFFAMFVTLALVLIGLGLLNREHSELALIGFLFLFLLSLIIINGDIQYKSGETVTNTYNCYSTCVANSSLLLESYETTYIYSNMEDVSLANSTLTHLVGYWLAVSSILGFIGVILGLRKSKGFK